MSHMAARTGATMAGGRPVHRIARSLRTQENEDPRRPRILSEAQIFECYLGVAAGMHRTVMMERGDRVIIGCTCQWSSVAMIGGVLKAEGIAKDHIFAMAEKLFERYEGHAIDKPPPEEHDGTLQA